MNGAVDLCDILADALNDFEREDDGTATYGETAEYLVQILRETASDPVRRLAILDAMGLDVRKGWLSGIGDRWSVLDQRRQLSTARPALVVLDRRTNP